MSGTLKVGILGAANIANKICRALANSDVLEVVCVGSRSAAKAQEMLDRWSIPNATAHDSYDKVVEDSRVDIAYIPLPTAMHVEWVEKCAAAGKHIMLEKPLAISPSDMDRIINACKKHNVLWMDGTMWVHHPRTREMKALIQQGALGNIATVYNIFTFAGNQTFLKENIRIKADCDPLGALGDVGWYTVRAILWAYGYETPISITAHPGSIYNDDGVPIRMGGSLVFEGDRTGKFDCGFDMALTQKAMFVGGKGSISVDGFVIPITENKAEFALTTEHSFIEYDTKDVTRRETKIVYNEKRQELLMWEEFAVAVRRVKDGGKFDDLRWNYESELTQRVLFAVLESAKNDCKPVALSTMLSSRV